MESPVEYDDVLTEKVPETRLENDEEKEQESIEVIEVYHLYITINFLNVDLISFCC